MKIPNWAFIRFRYYQPTVFKLADAWLAEQGIAWVDVEYHQLLDFFDKHDLVGTATTVSRGKGWFTWRAEIYQPSKDSRILTPANDMSRAEAEQTCIERCFYYLEETLSGKTPRSYELDEGEGTIPEGIV